MALEVSQTAGARRATGFARFRDAGTTVTIEAPELGMLQVAESWAAFGGRVRVSPAGVERPFNVIVDQADPFQSGMATVRLTLEGFAERVVPLAPTAVRITP